MYNTSGKVKDTKLKTIKERFLIMEANWKEFEIGPAKKGKMHVTLCRKGNIMVGAAAFDRLGRPDAAVLLYDEEMKLIGLRPAHPQTPNAFPMQGMKCGRHRVVRANRFCRHHGLNVERMMAFINPKIDGAMLILDMNEIRPVGKLSKEERLKTNGEY